ncbi:MAG: hypothetical protein QGG42_03095 [Phycisphaerae bacterium]|jgi:hypothetical protein|nr:hypothetical protein [Phycisphaerae bacterium]
MRNLICCIVIGLTAGASLGADAKPAEYQKAVRGTKSLISYYTFDAGGAADTIAKNHGKVVGKGAKFDAGVAGKAIHFTAKTALVEFGYVPQFAFKDGSGTIEVLLNHSGHTGGTNYIFAQRSGWEKNSMRYGFSFPNLKTMDIVSRGSSPNFARAQVLVKQDQWHHVAVVYDGGKLSRAYLDGNKLSIGGAAPLVAAADKCTFHLGAPTPKPDWECWSGRFDELAIYADPLDEKTIVEHAKLAGCLRKLPTRAPAKPAARQAPGPAINFDDYPLLTAQPIVFVTRRQYSSHYHAIDTLFHTGELNWDRKRMHADGFSPGGALKTIDFKTGEVTTLLETREGLIRDPDVHFDAKRIVFAMRRNKKEDYHIWEIGVDGKGLKQLTSLKGVSDFDPIYLGDDSIVFASTREPKYNMCSRDHAANLYRMNSDGSNIRRITRNTLFDNHPDLLPDGRIVYARWEYVDRNFGDAHGVWVVNPDGTNQAIYWGNNTASPGAVFNQHIIPGTKQMLCILGPHHDKLRGAMAIIDRRLGLDGKKPVVRTWPANTINLIRAGGRFDCDSFARFRPKYEDAWPLSDKQFLCARTIGKGDQTGLFLVDLKGNEHMLHTEAGGCYDPMPIKTRKRPPIQPSRRDFKGAGGLVHLQNVYRGTHMKGVKSGSIKYLRVIESPPKKTWSGGSWNGQGYQAPGMNWHDFTAKKILGDVPVEVDGSAYFEVPSDTFIYFQALDADKMMVQSMRSGTVVQSGETQSCIGCHEDRLKTDPAAAAGVTVAGKRKPSKLTGWYGPARAFSYTREVQPVFDKHCVKCHDFGKKPGAKLILAGDRNPYFNASYIDLWIWRRRLVKLVGGGPAEVQQAFSWGSHPSKLSQVIRKKPDKHKDLKLSTEDTERINTWLDLNGPYYPDYTCAYPDSQSGRSPIPTRDMQKLCKLTHLNYGALRSNGRGDRAQISFERPELSPCLARIKGGKASDAYKQALAIIRTGAAALKSKPRCDMEGFVPCAADKKRLAKFDYLDGIEQKYRKAIRTGKKLYDRDVVSAPAASVP